MEKTMRNNCFQDIKFYFLCGVSELESFLIKLNIRIVELVFTVRQLPVTTDN